MQRSPADQGGRPLRTFTRQGLGYVLAIPRLATELAVDRLSRSRGETHAELTVTCGLPGIHDGHLHQARLNLTSTTARATVAKHLAGRVQIEGLDWAELLEEVCRQVLKADRAGEPTVMVGTMPDRIGPAWRLEPILALDKPAILYGEGGTGKSTLAVAIAVSIQTGITVIPGWVPRATEVLYLDWETDAPDVDEKVKAIAAGAGIDGPVSIRYREMVGPLADQVESIARDVTEAKIGFVAVDSVGLAAGSASDGGDAAETALRLFAAFRVLRTTVLAVDHVAKAEADAQARASRPYGSIYKTNMARATFELRRDETGGDRSKIGIYNTKTNVGRRLSPIALWVDHRDGRITYERADLDGRLEEALPYHERIAAAIARADLHMLAVREIAEETGLEENAVRAVLSRHKARFTKLSNGSWGLLARNVG